MTSNAHSRVDSNIHVFDHCIFTLFNELLFRNAFINFFAKLDSHEYQEYSTSSEYYCHYNRKDCQIIQAESPQAKINQISYNKLKMPLPVVVLTSKKFFLMKSILNMEASRIKPKILRIMIAFTCSKYP